MNAAVARGSCLCGAVRFSASLPAKWVAHCHCTWCRRAHGAAFVTWAGFVSEQFFIDAGGLQPTWYQSSPGARRAFCPRCGSPMFFESTRWPAETHVARSLFADPLDKEPSAHVFYESHVPWLHVNDDLPKKVSQNSSEQPARPAAPPGSSAAEIGAAHSFAKTLDLMKYRRGTPADAERLAALIASFEVELTNHPSGAGAEKYLSSVTEEAERSYLLSERYFYILAFDNNELAGFIAIRDMSHIFHLFVARSHQSRGLARNLWRMALLSNGSESTPITYTVNSSVKAVPVYKAFGFAPVGEVMCVHGISFLPMQLNGSSQ